MEPFGLAILSKQLVNSSVCPLADRRDCEELLTQEALQGAGVPEDEDAAWAPEGDAPKLGLQPDCG